MATMTKGAELMYQRKRASITQAQLAEAVNVSVGTVGNWERGVVDIPLSKACAIADHLGITLEELAGR